MVKGKKRSRRRGRRRCYFAGHTLRRVAFRKSHKSLSRSRWTCESSKCKYWRKRLYTTDIEAQSVRIRLIDETLFHQEGENEKEKARECFRNYKHTEKDRSR